MSGHPDHERAPDEVERVAADLPLPMVPPTASQRMRNAFHTALPIVSAELIADTRSSGRLVGTRGGGASAWTMSYRAGDCDIVVDVVPRRAAFKLTGQLLCPNPTSDSLIRVFNRDHLLATTSTDEHGQFDLGEVERAEYVVSATASGHVIELVVDLRDRPRR